MGGWGRSNLATLKEGEARSDWADVNEHVGLKICLKELMRKLASWGEDKIRNGVEKERRLGCLKTNPPAIDEGEAISRRRKIPHRRRRLMSKARAGIIWGESLWARQRGFNSRGGHRPTRR